MKKIISFILACVMIALCSAFVSCMKKESVAGKWQGEYDAEALKKLWADDLSGLKVTGGMKYFFTFNEDGTYSFRIDDGSMADFWRENIQVMVDLSSQLAGVELTVDQFLAALGLEDTDGFAEYMKNSLPDASVDGTYSYSDGVLETDGEKSRVELSGDKLVIVEVTEAAGENEAINAALLPMTLTKVD